MKMHLYIYLFYHLYALLKANAEEIPPSPCPQVYGYELVDRPRDSMYMGVRGVITFQSGLPIFLKVTLQLPLPLTEYRGTLTPRDNFEIMEILRRSHPLKRVYYLDFEKHLPIPTVIEILLNDRLLCTSAPISGPRGKTTIYRFHSFTTALKSLDNNRVKEITTSQPGSSYEAPDISEIPRIPKRSKNPEIPLSPISAGLGKQKFLWEIPGFENCGLEYTPKELIVGGRRMERGQAPWMVPLFVKDGNQLNFTCTSVLISTEYIITAAHCVWNERKIYVACVGLYNINEWPDENSQIRGISRLHIHPNYRKEVDYDVAILKLSQEVRLNRYVNLVCIWNQEEDLRFVEGREATVVGWGTDGSNASFTETPHSIRMPIVSQETCRESNNHFTILTTSRTLCAGLRNGNGPCNGDSGGGLLLPIEDDKSQRRWVLRGVTSSALTTADNRCDLANYIIFSDLAKYQDWILGFIMKG